MAQDVTRIEVKRDASELFGDIEIPYYPKNNKENSDFDGNDDENRKHVWGALVPILVINGIPLQEQDLISLTLSSREELPRIKATFQDARNILTKFSQPKAQNTLQLVILPQFENVYKKIKLEFFMNVIQQQSDGVVYVEGIYKLNSLYNDLIKTYGELTTDKFLDTVGEEFGLGYATHIKYNLDDKHYRFINNMKPLDAFKRDIQFAGSSETQIYDWFVDFWNNINLIDYYVQMNNLTSEQQKCTVAPIGENNVDPTEGTAGQVDEDPQDYQEIDMIYTNLQGMQMHPLYIDNFKLVSNPGLSIWDGSEKEYKYYNEANFKHEEEGFDIILEDIDKDKDKIRKSVFLGQEYEEIPILKQKVQRAAYMQKMMTNTLIIHSQRFNFGVLRGGKLDVQIWEQDNLNMQYLEENEKTVKNNDTMWDDYIAEEATKKEEASPELNKYLSGQYVVTGVEIEYKDGQMGANYYLTRNELKTKYFEKDED